jgi:hypothetical protein
LERTAAALLLLLLLLYILQIAYTSERLRVYIKDILLDQAATAAAAAAAAQHILY